MNRLEEALINFDQLIKSGKFSVVQRKLKEISLSEIPRKSKYKFAEIARRSNMHYWSLSLLNPIIRSEKPLAEPAQPKEIVNYAAGLIRFGSYKEGFELLEGIDSAKYPEVLLFKTLGLINQWNYKKCISLMKEYLKSDRITAYQRAVGQYNLAAAYAFEGKDLLAVQLTENLVAQSRKENWGSLLANAYRVRAQVEFNTYNFLEAKRFNKMSLESFSGSDNLYGFFTRKLDVFINMFESQFSTDSQDQLERIKEEAQKRRHWETIRECDLYRSIVTSDVELLDELYFGTPYPSYRSRIKKLFGGSYKPSSHYLLGSRDCDLEKGYFDLSVGSSAMLDLSLEPFGVLHRCLMILVEDFYRPVSLGFLFANLYPNEFFDPLTSPDRVYKTIQRLRKWFHKNNISAQIRTYKNQFQFENNDNRFSIRIGLKTAVSNKKDVYIRKLKNHFRYKSFSSSEVEKVIDASNSSVLRLLKYALKNNQLIKFGKGRSVQYRFKS